MQADQMPRAASGGAVRASGGASPGPRPLSPLSASAALASPSGAMQTPEPYSRQQPGASTSAALVPARDPSMPQPIFRRPLLLPSSAGVNYGYGYTMPASQTSGSSKSPQSAAWPQHGSSQGVVQPLPWSLNQGPSSPPDMSHHNPAYMQHTRCLIRETTLCGSPCPFPGLLYLDGFDQRGRPVAVVNTQAFPRKGPAKDQALEYILGEMAPVVSQQDYVLVVVNIDMGQGSAQGDVSGAWALNVYRKLAKPFRKNVKHIVLVQPSIMAEFILAITKPFLSKKGGAKIKPVESLSELPQVTGGEVRVESLGQRFISTFLQAQHRRQQQLQHMQMQQMLPHQHQQAQQSPQQQQQQSPYTGPRLQINYPPNLQHLQPRYVQPSAAQGL